jgi:hypothetical protein
MGEDKNKELTIDKGKSVDEMVVLEVLHMDQYDIADRELKPNKDGIITGDEKKAVLELREELTTTIIAKIEESMPKNGLSLKEYAILLKKNLEEKGNVNPRDKFISPEEWEVFKANELPRVRREAEAQGK